MDGIIVERSNSQELPGANLRPSVKRVPRTSSLTKSLTYEEQQQFKLEVRRILREISEGGNRLLLEPIVREYVFVGYLLEKLLVRAIDPERVGDYHVDSIKEYSALRLKFAEALGITPKEAAKRNKGKKEEGVEETLRAIGKGQEISDKASQLQEEEEKFLKGRQERS